MKKIAILGSTGSIGTQTLDVVRANGDIEVLGNQCREKYKAAGRAGKRVSSTAGRSVGGRLLQKIWQCVCRIPMSRSFPAWRDFWSWRICRKRRFW